MEKLLGQYDKESMRMTMLKHKKHSNNKCKLHRLYRIQKTLMERSRPNRIRLDDSENQTGDHHGNGMQEVMDENHVELTLGPPRKKQHGIPTPPRKSSTESCHTAMGYRNGGESNVDLGEHLRDQVVTVNMT